MKVKLVFDDWRKHGLSVYASLEGIDLSSGSLHSGTIFDGTIEIDLDEQDDFRSALARGYTPVFYVIPEETE